MKQREETDDKKEKEKENRGVEHGNIQRVLMR